METVLRPPEAKWVPQHFELFSPAPILTIFHSFLLDLSNILVRSSDWYFIFRCDWTHNRSWHAFSVFLFSRQISKSFILFISQLSDSIYQWSHLFIKWFTFSVFFLLEVWVNYGFQGICPCLHFKHLLRWNCPYSTVIL